MLQVFLALNFTKLKYTFPGQGWEESDKKRRLKGGKVGKRRKERLN